MNLKLIKLTNEYKDQLIEMYNEWKADILKNNTNSSPWAIFKNDPNVDFDFYLENLDRKVATEDRVPSVVYFLLDEDRNKLLGACDIRLYLNEGLRNGGGHIGDGIRPSERRKGYATEMIRLALIKCKELGIYDVLVCCDENNIGSKKSIIKNGGIYEKTIWDGEENTELYWFNFK